MSYLLDTNICIYLIKKKPLTLVQLLQTKNPKEVGISSVTLGELNYGVEKSQRKETNSTVLLGFLAPMQVFPFDYAAAMNFGRIRAELEKKGTVIGPFDLMIAAHALALKAVLVTNNIREFKRVRGLNVENWVK